MRSPDRRRGLVFVEGHGEVEAVSNLIHRVLALAGAQRPWAQPLRWKNLHQWETPKHGGMKRALEFARTHGDVGAVLVLRDADDDCPRDLAPLVSRWVRAVLVLRDADDDCPRDLAPLVSRWVRAVGLPFPVACVLLCPEYEVLFLPCMDRMAEAGFPPACRWDAATWEARRGVKEWLSRQLPPGRAYKPTVDQLRMTRLLDLEALQQADVPCFGTLQRALHFLDAQWGTPNAAYPQAGNEHDNHR
jgi:hypothetical protein